MREIDRFSKTVRFPKMNKDDKDSSENVRDIN